MRRIARNGWSGTVAIASGIATLTGNDHTVDTEGAAATDDLDTVIFPPSAMNGDLFTLRPANGARTVVIRNGTGNIICPSDRSLDNSFDEWVGRKQGTSLVERSFANNGA